MTQMKESHKDEQRTELARQDGLKYYRDTSLIIFVRLKSIELQI